MSTAKCVPVAQSIALAMQKFVGSIPKEHTYWQKKMYSLNALDKSVY